MLHFKKTENEECLEPPPIPKKKGFQRLFSALKSPAGDENKSTIALESFLEDTLIEDGFKGANHAEDKEENKSEGLFESFENADLLEEQIEGRHNK